MDPFKMDGIFSAMTRPVAFVGHTHFPGVIEEGGEEFLVPDIFEQEYRLCGKRAIVNIGSVGQPRDRDNRACFVTFGDETLRYCRVPYDYRRTIEKINKLGEEYQMLGYRLGLGR